MAMYDKPKNYNKQKDNDKVRRVLIAEDEAIIRMDLKEILQQNGCEVVGEVTCGAKALQMARDKRPDCVFLDVRMDGCDGLDAARIICAERLSAVVILSAFSEEAVVNQAAEVGVMAYVSKPFSEADIVPAMSVAISRFEQTCALAVEVDSLQERLETRKVVEQAKGLLMKDGKNEAQAFACLRKLSMDEQKPMKEIAKAVIMVEKLNF
jgi:response regulator NasT